MRGPAFYAMTRLQTRRELRRRGYAPHAVGEMLEACDDDVIDAAATQAAVALPTTEAIGDGTIIQKILDFLQSEQGQALIKALIALLIGLI